MKLKLRNVLPAVLILTMTAMLFTGCNGETKPSEGTKQSTETDMISGGYTEQRDLTQEDRDLFDSVMKDVNDGKTYEPVSVATQVVAGTNYQFLVNVTEGDKEYQSYIVIYQPLPGQGDAELVEEE